MNDQNDGQHLAPTGGEAPEVGPRTETGDEAAPYRQSLRFPSGLALRELVGETGGHLKVIGKQLGLKVGQRGDQVHITGKAEAIDAGRAVLLQLFAVANEGHSLTPADAERACRLLAADPSLELLGLYREVISLGGGKRRLSPRTATQRSYVQAIRAHELVFGVGPAGTGKTFLAMAMALHALSLGEVKRIVLCRPAVEAGEKLGFLPGDLAEKVNPYLRPLIDALNDLAGYDRAERLLKQGAIEVAPLAFMRGRTLSEAFIILDEAQNTTPEQMKMFLTRLGQGSRVVVTGDITQIDLPAGTRSGLVDALAVLRGADEVQVIHFTDIDVVRHPLVATIIRAYARAEAAAAERADQRAHRAREAQAPRRRPVAPTADPARDDG
jgi:phosphate starvation-inducible PhoH-like protein